MTQQEHQSNLEERKILEHTIKQKAKPICLTKMFVNHPYIILGVGFIIFIIFTVIALAAEAFKMSSSDNRQYLVWSEERVEVQDMRDLMEEEFQKSLVKTQVPERTQDISSWSTNVILKCDDCNLFTASGLRSLMMYEGQILRHPDFQKFCLASTEDDGEACSRSAIISVNLIIMNTLQKSPLEMLTLTDQEITMVGEALFQNEQLWNQIKPLFGEEFTSENRQTNTIRTIFRFGAPIKVDGKLKVDRFDDEDDQDKAFSKFAEEVFVDKRDEYEPGSGKKLLTFSVKQSHIEMDNVIDEDTLWAIASISVVYVYVCMYLQSIFLGTATMIQILVSFPITQVIFRYIFGITYYHQLHIMAVFLILGIAADDVFILVATWRQTNLYNFLDKDPITRLHQRMAIAFKKASLAMLVTSATTTAAFIVTGFSDLMPVSSFGFYAATLIPVNYLLVILYFPAVLAVYESKCSQFLIFCIKRKEKQNQDQDQQNKSDQEVIDENKLPTIEKFFAEQFSPTVNKFKIVILGIFLIWIGIAIWQATEFKALTKPENFLPEDAKIEEAKNSALYDFHGSQRTDTGITVNQFWGVDGLDNDDIDMWDSKDIGKLEWDNNFDLSPEINQGAFLQYCVNLTQFEAVKDNEVQSFMFDFANFAQNFSSVKQFPVPQSQFLPVLLEYIQTPTGGYFYNSKQIGIIKNELKFVQIRITAKGTPFRPYDELNPIFEKWDNAVKLFNSRAPEGMNNSKQTAGYHWTWMLTEKAFVRNAVEGSIISMAIGFVILLIVTQNILVSLYSIISIGGIVVSVIAIMNMKGWELGITESMTMVILIGLSIDYVVHLAMSYVDSIYTDRYRRTKVALRDLGMSIVSGALTTAVAGFFLIFGTLVVFNKFAHLIIATVCFSLIFALLFFAALMHALGPQNDFGYIFICCIKKQQVYDSDSKQQSLENVKQQQQPQQDLENQQQQVLAKEEEQTEPQLKQQNQEIENDVQKPQEQKQQQVQSQPLQQQKTINNPEEENQETKQDQKSDKKSVDNQISMQLDNKSVPDEDNNRNFDKYQQESQQIHINTQQGLIQNNKENDSK